MRNVALTITAALLLVPISQAAPADSVLTAAAVGVDGTVQGALRVAQVGDQDRFTLHGAELLVRVVSSDVYSKPLGASSPFFSGTTWTTDEQRHSNAELVADWGRTQAGAFVFVVPLEPGAQLDAGCASMEAGPATGMQIPSQVVVPNPNPVLDRSDTMAVTPCGGFSICGSFEVSLWERDLVGAGNASGAFYESGFLPGSGADLRPVFGRAQQLYVTVLDGCLSAWSATTTTIYSPGIELEALALRASDAAGLVAGQHVQGSVELRGELRGTMTRQADTLTVAVSGIQAAHLDGLAIALPASRTAPAPLALVAVVVFVVVGVVAVGHRWRTRRQARREMESFRQLFEQAQSDGERAEYAAAIADAALRLGHKDTASTWLGQAFVYDPERLRAAGLRSRRIREILLAGYA